MMLRARHICGGWAAMTRGAGDVDRNFFWRAFNEYDRPTAKLAEAVARATAGKVRLEEAEPHLKLAIRARRAEKRRREAEPRKAA